VGQLDGKVVIVTGAAHGMGRSHARRCVAEGAHVVATDIQPIDGEVGSIGVRHDVSREQDWDAVIDTALSNFGRVDGLVNNAAVLHETCNLEDEDIETFRRTLEVNVVGTWWGIRKVIAPMRSAGGGSIVNISSTAGMRGLAQFSSYGTSKWAVRGLTKVAARDLGPWQIRVNSVHPGAIEETGMFRPVTSPEDRAARATRVPLGRFGRTDEVSSLVVFLLSDDSSYITGNEHVVDGGSIA
jgi:3alpha(or 20beta)-hydroxysteroid dehydrogenase